MLIMKHIIFFTLTFSSFVLQSQIFIGDKSSIKFFSETKVENIDAENKIAKPILDIQSGVFAIKAKQTDFTFKSSFMQEHYNENYMESEKFPFATFKGTINEKINITTNAKLQANITGTLSMHGVDVVRTITGTVSVQDGKVILESKFDVKVVDHKIKVPSLYVHKIAEIIQVTFYAELIPFKK